MSQLTSWRGLLRREYIEHRLSFIWVPLGILTLLALAGFSALMLNRLPRFEDDLVLPYSLKMFELGYLMLLALWLAYLAVAMFFFFGEAFHADRRNNAMLFWKSMPVSDLKVVVSKFVAGAVLFPLIVLAVGVLSGLVLFLLINLAAFVVPVVQPIEFGAAVGSFYEVTLFGVVYYALGIAWYAPFFAWVGALATVFGRWSLPLAFVVPALAAVIENVAFFGQGPQGGHIWTYLSSRWAFGLDDDALLQMASYAGLFRAQTYLDQLFARIDWVQLWIGLGVSAVLIWIASEYRRRRIV